METLTFNEFVDKRERAARKHLKILGSVLEQQGFQIKNHLDDKDPYIFVKNSDGKTSFEGIRIYQLGDQIAFRVQKQESTHPYGRAYPLDVEDMFNDLMSDHPNPEQAGKKLVESITGEVKEFFRRSLEAEKELRKSELDRPDPLSQVIIRGTGSDYSSFIWNKGS